MTRREVGKVTALTNPVSGHGAALRAAHTAIARLQQRGVEVVEIIGDDAEDARYLARAAVEKGTDALMVTGGDGVVSNALQVLAGTDIPLVFPHLALLFGFSFMALAAMVRIRSYISGKFE